MQHLKLLHKSFTKNIPSVHKKRLDNLMESAKALISSKKLTLTLLGRYLQCKAKVRSNIMKVNRLLANEHLHKEVPFFYKEMNRLLISEHSEPWIHVDWSCLSSKNKLYLLRASLSVKGRSIVVYEEAHTKKDENNHAVHKIFLENLKTLKNI